jgi:hypothetical protein
MTMNHPMTAAPMAATNPLKAIHSTQAPITPQTTWIATQSHGRFVEDPQIRLGLAILELVGVLQEEILMRPMAGT